MDRGAWGVELMVLLLLLKLACPSRVYLLRGNHESSTCTKFYGFKGEVCSMMHIKLLSRNSFGWKDSVAGRHLPAISITDACYALRLHRLTPSSPRRCRNHKRKRWMG